MSPASGESSIVTDSTFSLQICPNSEMWLILTRLAGGSDPAGRVVPSPAKHVEAGAFLGSRAPFQPFQPARVILFSVGIFLCHRIAPHRPRTRAGVDRGHQASTNQHIPRRFSTLPHPPITTRGHGSISLDHHASTHFLFFRPSRKVVRRGGLHCPGSGKKVARL